MMAAGGHDSAAEILPLRPKLIRLAYRMLGTLADAEDIVQEALTRWIKTERSAVRTPEAFLKTTVVRLCLDHLKAVRRRRETYIGPWLPEPLVEEEPLEDVTLSLMIALERLSPLERAAFILHDVFSMGFEEVASAIDRDVATCRQLAFRARAHVRQGHVRYPVEKEKALQFATAFFSASRSGDVSSLSKMLASDVVLYADGGGKRPAAKNPVRGVQPVVALHEALAKHLGASVLLRTAYINGLPGFVSREADGQIQTTALEVVDGKIAAIYIVRNPDKLRHLN